MTQDDHMITHVNTTKKLVTHFFAKEVSYDAYCQIEQNTLHAKEWGVEVSLHCNLEHRKDFEIQFFFTMNVMVIISAVDVRRHTRSVGASW